MSQPIDPRKIVVFSGAGISAESGLATFRDRGSLTVDPAASSLKKVRVHNEQIIISLEIDRQPFGYICWRAAAAEAVVARRRPTLVVTS